MAVLAGLCLLVGAGAARADLVFSQPQADAGEVHSGRPLSHAFPFLNRGTGPATVTEVRVDCGCLVPRLPRRTYQPGETGSLDLEVNTLAQSAGEHTWAVRVRYQAGGEDRDVELRLRGRVNTEVTLQPATVFVFASQAVRPEVVLTDRRARPFSLSAFRPSSPALRPRVLEQRDLEGGGRLWRVGVEVADDCPEGRHDEALSLYTDDPDYPELKASVVVLKRSRQQVVASPGEVTLTAPHGQPAPSRIVLLRAEGQQNVTVASITPEEPAVVCKWAEGPNHFATLRVTVDRARVHTPTLQSVIRVELSSPVHETLTLPVTCVLE